MRDRLIELLNVAVGDSNLTDGEIKIVADYLLENGVIVPPCKIGDKVYFVSRNSGKPTGVIDEVEIVMIGKIESGFCAKGKLNGITFDIMPHFEIDNYSFFLSREEAEQALKGGVQE